MDRTFGMDGPDANAARPKRADNGMVRTLGQSLCATELAGRLPGGVAEPGRARSGWTNGAGVRPTGGERVGSPGGRIAHRELPPPTGAARLDRENGHDREATTGHPGGAGSDRGSGLAQCSGTDLRAGLCRVQLWVSTRARLSGSGGKGGRVVEPRLRLVRGRGPQELLGSIFILHSGC